MLVSDYRHEVALDEPFRPLSAPAPVEKLDALTALALRMLDVPVPSDVDARRRLLRAVLTVRSPAPLDPELMAVLDALLGGERQQRLVGLPASVVVWRGDITRLMVDAIVNAANDALLGCFQPMHPCVDNAIHSAAGPRLREDCHRIMVLQGTPEATGTAKITRGYHLPASYVLHTVGPIVRGPLLLSHESSLASCYRSCLDLAASVPEIRTLAFCGVSTGIFGFPKRAAARIAVAEVRSWLGRNPGRFDRVVFVAFSAQDEVIYRELL
ncbi:protein-ADP-ribose hydrolase [Lentzea rhizosphaerae]|uniref:Protein-ADP-ribose hydrolase n=1 Tax=Lentzea rhizosphaerae TaxID=2041025 RepID=A0ABV8CAT4_9PSEU